MGDNIGKSQYQKTSKVKQWDQEKKINQQTKSKKKHQQTEQTNQIPWPGSSEWDNSIEDKQERIKKLNYKITQW